MMISIPQQFNLGGFLPANLSLGTSSIFVLLILVCVLLFALSLGRTRMLVSLLSIYVAFVLQATFPFFRWLSENMVSLTDDMSTLRVGVLLLAYIASFILMSRSVLGSRFNLSEASFFSVIIIGLIQVGFLISIILNLAPAYQQYLPAVFLSYIANQKALFCWALAPLILLIFQRGD
jgi:hypothetical protein